MAKTKSKKKKEENTIKYGLQICGNIRVFSKTKEVKGYEITEHWFNVSKKDDKDNWINKSMRLFFPKDLERPENNELIYIHEGFHIVSGNEGYERISLFVKDWDYVEE